MRAIKRWQAAHPGNDHVWPDHKDLLVWLMGRIDLKPVSNIALAGTHGGRHWGGPARVARPMRQQDA
jgi:hypothetical protein